MFIADIEDQTLRPYKYFVETFVQNPWNSDEFVFMCELVTLFPISMGTLSDSQKLLFPWTLKMP